MTADPFAGLAVPPTDLSPLRARRAGALPFAPRTYHRGEATVDLPDALAPLHGRRAGAWPWIVVAVGIMVLFLCAAVGR